MVKGFKDEQGRFHPIGDSRQNSFRPKSINYIKYKNGSSVSKQILKQATDFAQKKALQFKKWEAEQEVKKLEQLEKRKRLQSRIILSFKKNRALGITKPKPLKNAILVDIPELSDNKEDINFIQEIVNEFLKRERDVSKEIEKVEKKDPELARQLKQQFEKAEDRFENEFKTDVSKARKITDDRTEKELREAKKLVADLEAIEQGKKKAEDVFDEEQNVLQKLVERLEKTQKSKDEEESEKVRKKVREQSKKVEEAQKDVETKEEKEERIKRDIEAFEQQIKAEEKIDIPDTDEVTFAEYLRAE